MVAPAALAPASRRRIAVEFLLAFGTIVGARTSLLALFAVYARASGMFYGIYPEDWPLLDYVMAPVAPLVTAVCVVGLRFLGRDAPVRRGSWALAAVVVAVLVVARFA